MKMQFVAGKSYTVAYKLYPLKNKAGKDFSDTIIGGNFRYGTTENPSISNHTFANKADRSSGDGWITVSETVNVPADYTAGERRLLPDLGQIRRGCWR